MPTYMSGIDAKKASIDCALASLRMLDYPDLLELSVQRDISLPAFPSPVEFQALDTSKQQKIETQLEQTVVCHAVYGNHWLDCDRRTLNKIVCNLRKALPNAGKLVPFPSILDELLESASEATATDSRLRLEMAEHLLFCAMTRVKVIIARGQPQENAHP